MKINHYLKPALLFAVPFFLYIGSAHFDFSYFDDNQLILENSGQFEAPFTWEQYFLTGADVGSPSVYYRPLQNLSYHIDTWMAGGVDPGMFHFSNVFLFAILIVCLYVFLRRIDLKEKYAFWLAMLYAVHPVNVCSASWIPARGDLLLVISVLISFTWFITFLKTRKWLPAVASVLFFGVALLSKETAAILPFMFLLYYLLISEAKKLGIVHGVYAFALLCVGIVWFSVRTSVVISNAHMGWGTFFANWQHFPSALTQWFFPYYWNTLPIYTVFNTGLGLIALMGLVFLVYKYRTRRAFLGLAWFILFMIPLFLVLPCDFDYLEHRFLLPLIGVLIVLGEVWEQVKYSSKWTNFALIGLAAVLFVLSYVKSLNYQDPEVFYTEAIQYNPAGLPYQNRGLYRQNKGNLQGALEDYNEAVKVEPRSITAPLTRGIIKGQMGDFTGGIEDINKSIQIADTSYDQHFQRGFLEEKAGDLSAALADYNKAIQMKPDFYLAYNNRGSMKERMGDNAGALTDFLTCIRLHPQYSEAYSNAALIYYRTGDLQQAVQYLDLAAQYAENVQTRQLYESRKRMVQSKMSK